MGTPLGRGAMATMSGYDDESDLRASGTPILKNVNRLLTVHGAPRKPREELKRVFASYDQNYDGKLDAQELTYLVRDIYMVAIAEAREKGAPKWYLEKARDALYSERGEEAVAAAVEELLSVQEAHGGKLDWTRFVDDLDASEKTINKGRYWRLAPICDIKIVLDDFVDPYRRPKIFLAGGLAGALAKSIGSPLARVTILKQTAIQRGATTGSIPSMLRSIIAKEGLRGLFRGNGLDVLRSFPSQGISFLTFEVFKSVLRPYDSTDSGAISRFAAGSLAGCTAILTTYPLDLMRTRVVCAEGPVETSIVSALSSAVKSDGFLSLYRGAGVACLEKAPSLGINFTTYDILKTRVASLGLPDNMASSLGCGVVAGAVSSTATYPLDVIMKNLQLDGAGGTPRQYAGFADCIRQNFLRSGIRGFYAGLGAQLAKAVPMASASLAAYSTAKDLLGLYHMPD